MPARWRIMSGPTSYIEINNFYTATVYEKGAEVIRMLRLLVGAEGYDRRAFPLFRPP
jgi:aminopeptidase N